MASLAINTCNQSQIDTDTKSGIDLNEEAVIVESHTHMKTAKIESCVGSCSENGMIKLNNKATDEGPLPFMKTGHAFLGQIQKQKNTADK